MVVKKSITLLKTKVRRRTKEKTAKLVVRRVRTITDDQSKKKEERIDGKIGCIKG